MKKIFLFLTMTALLLSFVACSKDKEKPTAPKAPMPATYLLRLTGGNGVTDIEAEWDNCSGKATKDQLASGVIRFPKDKVVKITVDKIDPADIREWDTAVVTGEKITYGRE